MDCIVINELEVYSNHGVYKEENVLGQKFLVSAKLYTSLQKPGLSDNIDDSINYGDICQFITHFMKQNTFNLLEAIAEKLSYELLINHKNIESLWLEIKKPWAPIGLPLKNVGVEVTRGFHRVYLSLGSNMGDKQAYLENAIKSIDNNPYCSVRKVSEFIVSKAHGYEEQEDFLNACMKIKTIYSAYELLKFIRIIESEAKRVRTIHWGPRTLDVDILLYDNDIMTTSDLIIPHPQMEFRSFVIDPLKEIAPNAYHPVLQKRIKDIIVK